MSKAWKRFIIIGGAAVICAFTMMVAAVKSEAQNLSVNYKVVTVYCLNGNCQKDKGIDSKLENALNRIRRDTLYFQNIVSIVPMISCGNSTGKNTSGYIITIKYFK